MNEIISLFLIGLGLSADAFSISLSVGSIYSSLKKQLLLSILVGIAHFLMPILGLFIGSTIISQTFIKSNYIISFILLLLALQLIYDLKDKNKTKIIFNVLGILIFVISVSLDSFSTGLGLYAITNNYILAGSIFALVSSFFTFLGLLLGRKAKNFFGNIANIIGALILFTLAIIYFCS